MLVVPRPTGDVDDVPAIAELHRLARPLHHHRPSPHPPRAGPDTRIAQVSPSSAVLGLSLPLIELVV